MAPCKNCGKTCETSRQVIRENRVYCGEVCKTEFVRRVSSETMARTNRKYAAARMKARNPMRDTKVRQKVSSALRKMQHRPNQQGGNGRKLPEAQRKLADALNWPTEVIVQTGCWRGARGYPTHYLLDSANLNFKIDIEVDGTSHRFLAVKRRDLKRTAFLELKGWTVLRFSNQQVMEHLEECVQTVMSTISKLKAAITTSPTAA